MLIFKNANDVSISEIQDTLPDYISIRRMVDKTIKYFYMDRFSGYTVKSYPVESLEEAIYMHSREKNVSTLDVLIEKYCDAVKELFKENCADIKFKLGLEDIQLTKIKLNEPYDRVYIFRDTNHYNSKKGVIKEFAKMLTLKSVKFQYISNNGVLKNWKTKRYCY